jgi:hypothetical protein
LTFSTYISTILLYWQIFTFGGERKKKKKKKKKKKEKRKKRKKKEDFLNVECEELTYPFSLLFEFSFAWT